LKVRLRADGIPWVQPRNLHVTLRFLGDSVDLHMISPLIEVLKTIAAQTASFLIKVRGVGAFPNPRRPRIIWVGLLGEDLTELAARIDRAAVRCGSQPERRPFAPHVTIARMHRVNQWGPIRRELAHAADLDFGVSRVSVAVYRSIREIEARIYEEIASFTLAGTPPADTG
jgi:RNA 2',3'-cyclic 3'-phosphodiesterase